MNEKWLKGKIQNCFHLLNEFELFCYFNSKKEMPKTALGRLLLPFSNFLLMHRMGWRHEECLSLLSPAAHQAARPGSAALLSSPPCPEQASQMSHIISVTRSECSDVPLSQLFFWWPHQTPPQAHIKSKVPCLVTILRPAKSTCSIIHRSATSHWCWYFSKYTYLGEAKDYFALSAARESTRVTFTTCWCVLIYRGSYTLCIPTWWPDGWIALNLLSDAADIA